MPEDVSTIHVYPCELEEVGDGVSIGTATSKSQAASKINKFLSQRDGYDPELKGSDIGFIQRNGQFLYFIS